MSKVGELFAKLPQNRVIVDPGARKSRANGVAAPSAAEATSRRFGGITQISVRPEGADCQSLVAMLEERAAQAEVEFEPLVIRVALDSEHCSGACALLENRGFRFCGVIPQSDGRDWILYSKFDPSILNGVHAGPSQTKSLLHYIQSYRAA